jgi:hypothetical protein
MVHYQESAVRGEGWLYLPTYREQSSSETYSPTRLEPFSQ